MQGPRDLPPLVPLSTRRDRSGEPEHLLTKLDKQTARIPVSLLAPLIRWDDKATRYRSYQRFEAVSFGTESLDGLQIASCQPRVDASRILGLPRPPNELLALVAGRSRLCLLAQTLRLFVQAAVKRWTLAGTVGWPHVTSPHFTDGRAHDCQPSN